MFLRVVGGRRFWRRAGLLAALLATLLWLGEPLFSATRQLVVGVARVGKILPVYSVDTGGAKKLALSFDACWGAERTGQILDILEREGVKTTFFLVNIWLKDYPEKARLIAAKGHELGLHSTTHPHFTQLSPVQMQAELLTNAQMIEAVTGRKARLFRPPFGDYNNTVISTVQEMGLVPIQWSVDSLDWKNLSAQEIYQRVTDKVAPGAIVLFHNDGAHTPEALPDIISYIKREGYQIVPISELLLQGDYYVDLDGVQRRQ